MYTFALGKVPGCKIHWNPSQFPATDLQSLSFAIRIREIIPACWDLVESFFVPDDIEVLNVQVIQQIA